jgi:6-phosphogluconolactonase
LALTGCGSGSSSFGGGTPPPPPPAPEFLFAAANNTVITFSVDTSSGELTQNSYVAGNHGGFGIIANPANKFLYTDDTVNDGIDAFSIGSAGALTAINGSPFPMPSGWSAFGVDNLAIDPAGKFLYSPDGTSNSIAGFTIDGTSGALAPIPGSPFPTGIAPVQVVVHSSGKFLYVSDSNDPQAGISAFTIDSSTGALTPITGSPFGSGVNAYGLAMDSSGKFLFAVEPLVSEISAFTIDSSTGILTPVAGSPFSIGGNFNFVIAWSITISPSGQFLYALGSVDGGIFAFNIDPNSGALTPNAGSPFNIEIVAYMSAMSFDPSGKFLYVGIDTGSMEAMSVDETTGALTVDRAMTTFAYGPSMAIIQQK